MTNKTSGTAFLAPENIDVPTTVDWRPKGYVTPVKNQVLSFNSCKNFYKDSFNYTHKVTFEYNNTILQLKLQTQ